MKKSPLRQIFFTLHLWLGLASGIVVTILCFTGFLLALHPPVQQWLNRDLAVSKSGAISQIEADRFVRTILESEKRKFNAIEFPADDDGTWKFREGRDTVYADPATGESLGSARPLFPDGYRIVFRLHRWLLLDDSLGRPITGAATLIFLLVTLSGLYLWFDKCRKNFTRGLSFKSGVGWKRLNYDAHLVFGIYTLIPVLIMALSGLFWSYNSTFKTVSYRLLDGTKAPVSPPRDKREKKEPELVTDLPFQAVIETVQRELPYRGAFTVRFPDKGSDKIVVTKTPVSGFWQVPGRDELQLDITTAQVLEKNLYADKTRAEKFLSIIKPIHVGTIWGNFTVVIYLLACLLATTLPVTGTVMWWNRLRAQRRADKTLKKRRSEGRRAPDAGTEP